MKTGKYIIYIKEQSKWSNPNPELLYSKTNDFDIKKITK